MTTSLKNPFVGHTVAKPGPVLLVVLDRTFSRFFVDNATGLHEIQSPFIPWSPGRFQAERGHAPGMGEKHFHNVQNEHHRRHYHAVALRLATCLKEEQAIGVILGGAHRTLAEFRAGLPEEISRAVLNTMALNPRIFEKKVMRQEAEAVRHFMK